jgi:hypothetical protein
MQIAHYTPDDVRLVFPGEFGDDLTPEASEKWAAGRFDENGDFIDTYQPPLESTEAELAERRVRKDLERRKDALYAAAKSAGVHPLPHARWTLDNLTNPFVDRVKVCADFARLETELAAGTFSIAKGPIMQPLRHRLKNFKLPDYLWDGILIQRFCYSLTAQTGAGKTAIAIRLAFHVARGEKLCGRDVERGPVIYLAGENPDDVDMRWFGICHTEGIKPDDLDIHTIAGAGNIMEHAEQIKNTCRADNIRPALIIVDTAAAYFSGDDDNHNTQMGNYARQLRELCKLPGEPCVVILVHPTKGAKDFGEMVPRGGGAFLNEMDGNLAGVRDGTTVGIQAVGKFRGPEFTPLHFGLHTVHDCPALFDPAKNRYMPTVIVREMTDAGVATRKMERETMDVRLIRFVDKNPGTSLEQIAVGIGTNKSAVNRIVDHLINDKLLKRDKLTKKLTLTPTAQASLNELDYEQKRGETVPMPMVPFPGIPGPRI